MERHGHDWCDGVNKILPATIAQPFRAGFLYSEAIKVPLRDERCLRTATTFFCRPLRDLARGRWNLPSAKALGYFQRKQFA